MNWLSWISRNSCCDCDLPKFITSPHVPKNCMSFFRISWFFAALKYQNVPEIPIEVLVMWEIIHLLSHWGHREKAKFLDNRNGSMTMFVSILSRHWMEFWCYFWRWCFFGIRNMRIYMCHSLHWNGHPGNELFPHVGWNCMSFHISGLCFDHGKYG